MSEFQRRDFLAGAAAFAAATTAALVGTRQVEAGDPSFMNNVPDPLLAGKELPTFKFALEKSKGRVDGKSYAKEATVRQLPISKGIAGVAMGLAPGVMRELHWHATAAEWAFVNKGRVRTMVTAPGGYEETNDFEPGDVWYFPRGHAHVLECLGDEPCHFIGSPPHLGIGSWEMRFGVRPIHRHFGCLDGQYKSLSRLSVRRSPQRSKKRNIQSADESDALQTASRPFLPRNGTEPKSSPSSSNRARASRIKTGPLIKKGGPARRGAAVHRRSRPQKGIAQAGYNPWGYMFRRSRNAA